jgi:3-hydroxyethyl bacteriochlorophyllide a dehydrogenase
MRGPTRHMVETVTSLEALAVVLEQPKQLALRAVPLSPPGADDAVVDILWSGISTGTERLLWAGSMPPFPGMGYPLVPGYESVGRVVRAGATSQRRPGEHVFVPGARCYGAVNGLFGGAASRVVVPGARLVPVDERLGERAVLMALAATAHHAVHAGTPPRLIVGHGVLGRLVARLALLAGVEPLVWETNPARRDGAQGYRVIDPGEDERRDYPAICEVSGDAGLLDSLIQRLAPGGEITLAGFYHERLSFAFPPAFMREARLRVAAEWKPADLSAVSALAAQGRLSLDGLITHRSDAAHAPQAYRTAFEDPECLKMILDWRHCR